MKPYKFGDLLYYTSPQKPRRTRCVYVREDAGKAVVLFKHAEFVARVNYVYLSSDKQEDSDKTCKTCAVICQRLGCDIPACPSYRPFRKETS